MNEFTNNEAKSRFELAVDGQTAYADYRLEGQTLYVDYVYAPPELRGTGAASELMRHIADYAEKKTLTIVPVCGYAAQWMKHHNL